MEETNNNISKPVAEKLKPIDGYVLGVNRNTENGYYELNIGVPKDWEILTSKTILSEVILHHEENGDILRIYSKDEDVVIDDLLDFVIEIVKSNEEIEQIQRELDEELANKRKNLEAELKMIYETFENRKKQLLGKNKPETQELKTNGKKTRKTKTEN